MAWVTGTAPVIRDTGDFVLGLGNTTWRLRDVFFDTPGPRSAGRWTPDERPMTDDEHKQTCTHKQPDGLTRAPAAWVTLTHVGSDDHERLVGGPESNLMRGLGGNDTMLGNGGHDRLRGGADDDRIDGGQGRDAPSGGPGADTIVDHAGPTIVRTGTAPADGRDEVDVRDVRGDDAVVCGSPRSVVVADRGDDVSGRCGRVVVRNGPA